VGPKRDIVGIWARAARERGLKFGVSNHSAHAWHWFQPAYGYDPEGPRAGERYDAWKLTKYDGKGKWWEGLDPQELYAGAVMPMPAGIASVKDADAWHAAHDRVWEETPPLANPAFVRQWYLRCKDLIDSYQPDLLYFDNTGLPLGQAGLDMTAHFYNSSSARHGSLQAVVNCKMLPDDRRAAVVEDVERGFRSDVVPHPWQTDTCIGDWHYNRERFLQKSYVPADAVVHRLCDVVSKNGCLLLSIPVRGDGTIDEEERKIVEGVAGWTGRYGDAIFGSRPWRLSGEGPTQVASGQFGERTLKPFEAADIRFTTKGATLFTMTLGQPQGMVHIKSLAARGTVRRVEILGMPGPLTFQQDADGLHVTVPPGASHAYGAALKIDGEAIV
jgi:alpha-L-fucosidase